MGAGLLNRRRLQLRRLTRSRGETSEREVSPQRLVHHRNSWYLKAWCNSAQALRRFALDATESANLLDAHAKEMVKAKVEAGMDSACGIDAGASNVAPRFDRKAVHWASRDARFSRVATAEAGSRALGG